MPRATPDSASPILARPQATRSSGALKHNDWFVAREVMPGIWELAEPTHVCTWLVAGEERAVLLDTGLGICPIRPVAEGICGRPVEVVTTHYHFDHVGGHHEFSEIAVHEAGVHKLAAGTPKHIVESYLQALDRKRPHVEALLDLNDPLGLLSPETRPLPWPAGFDRDAWSVGPSRATRVLAEGDHIDLGNRSLTVLHTPGHSPDGISLLDEKAGVLFAADAFNLGDIYCHFEDSCIDELASTARRLAGLTDSVRAICVHHYPRVIAETSFLKSFADDVERVASDEIPYSPGFDCFGNTVRSARFDYYAVTTPAPDVPPIRLHEELS